MVAGFHHDEQIQGIGRIHGLRGCCTRYAVHHARGVDLFAPPARRLDRRAVEVVHERLYLCGIEPVFECRHLGGMPALGNDLLSRGALQPLEVFRQQHRAHGAQAVRAMAGGTVLLVQLRGFLRGRRNG